MCLVRLEAFLSICEKVKHTQLTQTTIMNNELNHRYSVLAM